MKDFIKSSFNRLPQDKRRFIMKNLMSAKLSEFEKLRYSEVGGYSLRDYENLGSIFIHIPKTGGTSVNNALVGNKGAGHVALYFIELLYSKKELDALWKFAFVRNPWSRLYSSFRYLVGGGGNEFDRKWSERNLAGIDDFEQFVTEWLNADRVKGVIHLEPQITFLKSGRGVVGVDFVGRFENFEHDFQIVVDRLNSHATLPHLNKSASSMSYRDAFDQKMIDKVSKIYAEDISQFGYEF